MLDSQLSAWSRPPKRNSSAVPLQLKATYSPSIGDAYALTAAKDIDNGDNVTLLVDADDDYDVFEDEERYTHLIERHRDESA